MSTRVVARVSPRTGVCRARPGGTGPWRHGRARVRDGPPPSVPWRVRPVTLEPTNLPTVTRWPSRCRLVPLAAQTGSSGTVWPRWGCDPVCRRPDSRGLPKDRAHDIGVTVSTRVVTRCRPGASHLRPPRAPARRNATPAPAPEGPPAPRTRPVRRLTAAAQRPAYSVSTTSNFEQEPH